MVFDRTAGGHRFAFGNNVCIRCGMSRREFEDGGRPRCTGQRPKLRQPVTFPPDDDPPEAA